VTGLGLCIIFIFSILLFYLSLYYYSLR